MKVNSSSRKKKLLALFLSLMMGVSAIAGFSACKEDDSPNSSSSSSSTSKEEIEDNQVITNGDFETFDNGEGNSPIVTSVEGWTRAVNTATSGSALASKSASGIVDTATWDDLTTSALTGDLTPATLTEEQAKEKWSSMTTRDKLEYYEAWKKANSDGKITELSFYQSFNIDEEDLPLLDNGEGVKTAIANPGTHYSESELENQDDEDKTNTKVLMLHNEYSNSAYSNLGTAQKFTSSTTVTVKAGTSAKFSVWVKTSNLTCTGTDGEVQDIVDKGAYITITHSVGGQSLDPLTIKNIDTTGVDANNGWVQYEFALKGSSYTDATFTIALGLGLGGGTDRYEYVNGYAFFDDAQCTIIPNDEYAAAATNASMTVDFTTAKEDKILNANETGKKFALNFYGDFESADNFLDGWTIADTTEKGYSSKKGADKVWPALKGGFDATNDVVRVADGGVKEALENGSDNAKAFFTEYYQSENKVNGIDFITQKSLVLYSEWGTAYTAKSPEITIGANTYLAYSFFVKTSEMNGFTGAGVTVVDGANKTSIDSIDSTTATPVTVVTGDEETDIYDGWQQCFLFLSNETEDEIKVQISFTFGTLTIKDTDRSAYYKGSAVFTGFAKMDMTKDEFKYAKANDYSKIITLKGGKAEASGDNGFDLPTNLSLKNIENGYADPQNYKGVYSDSAYVTDIGENFASNSYKNAGLLNKKHADNYGDILTTLGGVGATWESVFGNDTTQPLVIYNDGSEAHDKPYGFIGSEKMLSAESPTAISLRVKAKGTSAFIYLMDTSGDENTKSLSIGRARTYWYDDKGNVLTSYTNANGKVLTPDDEDYIASKGLAFKLQSNGLYLVNTAWAGATGIPADRYFANLSAYDEVAGNLVVADGGVSYDYSDNWKHDGNDQIAFYNYNKEENKAFAYSDNSTPVYDFSTVTTLAPRFEAIDGDNEKKLFFKVDDTNGQWVTVTFYIYTGEKSKNYRLEVWSGDKNGNTASAEGSYVIFDASGVSNPADATTYNSLLNFDERKTYLTEGEDYFEGIFSFYDSAKYLRYDASLDEKKVGNKYDETYVAPESASVAYLKDGYKMFVNYSTLETKVNAKVVEDNPIPDEEEETATDDTNVWLLASSIAIAAVLVFAVASLIVRKVVVKMRKKRGTVIVKSTKLKKGKKQKKN